MRPDAELIGVPLETFGGIRREAGAVRATRVQEHQRAIRYEGHLAHLPASTGIDPVRGRTASFLIALDGVELRAPALAFAWAREIEQAGHESPLRIAVR